MRGQKTTLLFQRNQDRKKLLKYIPTDYITEVNELIYAGAQVRDRIVSAKESEYKYKTLV